MKSSEVFNIASFVGAEPERLWSLHSNISRKMRWGQWLTEVRDRQKKRQRKMEIKHSLSLFSPIFHLLHLLSLLSAVRQTIRKTHTIPLQPSPFLTWMHTDISLGAKFMSDTTAPVPCLRSEYQYQHALCYASSWACLLGEASFHARQWQTPKASCKPHGSMEIKTPCMFTWGACQRVPSAEGEGTRHRDGHLRVKDL